MQSSSPADRPRYPWLKWGVPVAVLVLLTAGVAGLAVQRRYDQAPVRQAGPVGGPPPMANTSAELAAIEFTPDAQAHPDQATIRWTLQMHFNAINLRQYDTWKSTVVAAKQREMPEPKWKAAYATTHDAAVKVHRIEPGPDNSLRLLMTFISTQDPDDAPTRQQAHCLRWRVVYPMVVDSGSFRLDTNSLPGSALAEPC